ncbi:hypothetical protein [Thiosocius teredinicola]|uniref:hypothetical protein n=1 Tax=Thiosocius teredinicola TaxID=1973002 RepID=UPI000990BB83
MADDPSESNVADDLESHSVGGNAEQTGTAAQDASKSSRVKKPRKVLPAQRVSTVNQFELLRAFAIASGDDRSAVGIQDVASIRDLHPNTVSMCNPFFTDTGLIVKHGHKFVPSPEVVAYSERAQWNSDDCGEKLAPIIKETWFAKALIPRLQLRSVNEDEAIALFADISGASPAHKSQLIMLLDYLQLSGLINRDNGVLKLEKVSPSAPPANTGENKTKAVSPNEGGNENTQSRNENIESFVIPIPGKDSATISVPKGLDDSDWQMMSSMLDLYIKRMQERNR